jgi:putative acyl-CoA dehydrogenase
MAAQVETGHLCPITMTRAAVAALAAEPPLIAKLMPKIMSRRYDSSFRPWWEKTGITLGMGMTEKQGGTDVRANRTRAESVGQGYAISGDKWFMSAPMCDAFLVLAQAAGGLTCVLMPRFRPDGSVNALHFQRLKDKLGNRSNASSEVEFADAFAWRVGEEGRGVRTIINMVQLTRLDCAIASAGLMRMALAQAIHHARYRTVFQKHLADQPMMRTVLADMALEVEAATALVMRLARSFDLAASDPREAMRARLLTPAVKYWVCKSAPGFIYEAMECLGGNGYVEESLLPRLYREAPVNAIWEGSGNVMCLDVLRALARDGDAGRNAAGGAGCRRPRTCLVRVKPWISSSAHSPRPMPRRGRGRASAASLYSRPRRHCARPRRRKWRSCTRARGSAIAAALSMEPATSGPAKLQCCSRARYRPRSNRTFRHTFL